MTAIYEITQKSARGNNITFRLLKQGATEPDPMDKLPVLGYSFRFAFSEFGFGHLNRNVTLELLDDADDTFYNLFNNTLRNDLALEIIHEDLGRLFYGFADFQQLTQRRFEEYKKSVTIRFYTGVQYNLNLGYYSTEIQNEITKVGNAVLLTDFFIQAVFRNEPDGVAAAHRWTSNLTRPSGITTDYSLFNEVWYHNDSFDEDISISEAMALVSRSFFFRYGYSFTHNKNLIAQNDSGYQGSYDLISFKTPKVSVAPTLNVYDTDLNDDVSIPVLEKDKFLRSVRSRDINPYASVTYSRVGPAYTDGVGRPNTFTQENENDLNPFLYDSYRASEIPFDSNISTFVASALRALSQVGTDDPNLFLFQGFLDSRVAGVRRDITELNAILHMNIRTVPEKSFVNSRYAELLDPMLLHLTDFDDNAYIIVRGKYDLFREETEIQQSISQPTEDIT